MQRVLNFHHLVVLLLVQLQCRSPTLHLRILDKVVRLLLALRKLYLLSIKKVSLVGKLSPLSLNEWSLKAQLRATVKQKCVISFKPVQTTVNETINRTFSPLASENTMKMEEDDGTSPVIFDDSLQEFNDEIDLMEIIFEELIIILPLYPKFEGAELGSYTVTEPGVRPLNDENLKPFAQLSEFKDKLLKNK